MQTSIFGLECGVGTEVAGQPGLNRRHGPRVGDALIEVACGITSPQSTHAPLRSSGQGVEIYQLSMTECRFINQMNVSTSLLAESVFR